MPEKSLAGNLVKTMQYEYKTYLEILKLAEKKTDLLIKNDVESLVGLTEEEKRLAEQTLKLNQVREQILSSLCGQLNLDYKDMTIEKLKEHVKDEYKVQFDDIKTKLNDVLTNLSARNGINSKLIENALKFVNFNIQLIASPEPASPIYGKGGQEVSNQSGRAMLDVKF